MSAGDNSSPGIDQEAMTLASLTSEEPDLSKFEQNVKAIRSDAYFHGIEYKKSVKELVAYYDGILGQANPTSKEIYQSEIDPIVFETENQKEEGENKSLTSWETYKHDVNGLDVFDHLQTSPHPSDLIFINTKKISDKKLENAFRGIYKLKIASLFNENAEPDFIEPYRKKFWDDLD